jgi:hypothetical protein
MYPGCSGGFDAFNFYREDGHLTVRATVTVDLSDSAIVTLIIAEPLAHGWYSLAGGAGKPMSSRLSQ